MLNNSSLKQIADYQMLNSGFCPKPGLLDGKMGIVIFFFLCARYSHNNWYEEFAGELLDDVCGNLQTSLPVTFADGLCGIGWGVEFLKKQGFIEGDTDEILSNIDRQIMERDVRRISDMTFETGLEGIAIYIRSRIDSFRTVRNEQIFDPVYLADLETACQKAGIEWHSESYTIDSVWTRIKDLLTTYPFSEKDNWKKGLTKIKATYE